MFVPCGHTVCAECGEAIETAGGMTCCVCGLVATKLVPNTPLRDALAVCAGVTRDVDSMPAGGDATPLVSAPVTPGGIAHAASAPGKSGDGEPLCCDGHPDREALCFCPQDGTLLCVECVTMGGHNTHGVVQPDALATMLGPLLAMFEDGAAEMSALAAPVLAGAVEVSSSGEAAVMRAKDVFAHLHELLDKREALVLHTISAESKRRAKALETQAAELEVTIAQGRAVVQAGRAALETLDPSAIARAHRLAATSRGLLDGAMFLKETPHVVCNLGLTEIQHALCALGEIGPDPSLDCAQACYAAGRLEPSAAAWRQLLAAFSSVGPAVSASPAAAIAFCQAASTLFAKDSIRRFTCANDDVLVALAKIIPKPTASSMATPDLQPYLAQCEAWCKAVGHAIAHVRDGGVAPLPEMCSAVGHGLTVVLRTLVELLPVAKLLAPSCYIHVWKTVSLFGGDEAKAFRFLPRVAESVDLWNRTLEAFSESPDVLAKLWASYTWWTGSMDPVNAAVFSEHVIGTMQKFPSHEMVQAAGLNVGASHGHVLQVFPNVAELGLGAMAIHPRSEPVHRGAFALVTRDLRALRSTMDLVRAVSTALAQPCFCADTRTLGLWLQQQSHGPTSQERWLETDYLAPLSGSPSVVLKVLARILMCSSSSLFDMAFSELLYSAVGAAAAAHAAIEPIHFAVCRVVAEWSRRGPNTWFPADAKFAVVSRAMRAHPNSERVQLEGGRAIGLALKWIPDRDNMGSLCSAVVTHPHLPTLLSRVLPDPCKHALLEAAMCTAAESWLDDEQVLFFMLRTFYTADAAGTRSCKANQPTRIHAIARHAIERFPWLEPLVGMPLP